MPPVEAFVCSIIAVPRVSYCRANSEAVLLQLHYIKQMSSKLQKTAQKRKHRMDPLKVKSLFIFLWEAWARQLAGIETTHILSIVVIKWKENVVNLIDIPHAPPRGAGNLKTGFATYMVQNDCKHGGVFNLESIRCMGR